MLVPAVASASVGCNVKVVAPVLRTKYESPVVSPVGDVPPPFVKTTCVPVEKSCAFVITSVLVLISAAANIILRFTVFAVNENAEPVPAAVISTKLVFAIASATVV